LRKYYLTAQKSCGIISFAAYKRVINGEILPCIASSVEREVLWMYAVVETGGNQYKVQPGDVIFVEKIEAGEGETVKLDRVLMVGRDDGIVTGSPTVEGASVTAKVVKNGKGPKIMVFKFKAKKNYRKRQGHRQPYTKLQIEAVEA